MAKNVFNKKAITAATPITSIAALYYDFYKQKNRKIKIDICNQPNILIAIAFIFAIKKVKISKYILNKKIQLLAQFFLYYKFYKEKSENRYIIPT